MHASELLGGNVEQNGTRAAFDDQIRCHTKS